VLAKVTARGALPVVGLAVVLTLRSGLTVTAGAPADAPCEVASVTVSVAV
jgi:hypothetical protein